MPFDDPSLPPRPEIPQQMRTHNLLNKGDRTFENSVNRRMHAKSTELKKLIQALIAYQNIRHNSWEAKDPLRSLERAVVEWENKHPKEVEKRGRLLPSLKEEIRGEMSRYGMQPTINNHVRYQSSIGLDDAEHGEPVNLWVKSRSAMWGAYWLASTGASVGTNLSGGGTLAMVGLGTTLFTVSAATGVGLVIGGCAVMVGSSIIQAKSAWSSRKHKKALEVILQNAGRDAPMCNGLMGTRCDHEEHMEILDTVLPYVIKQKGKKAFRRGIGSIPIVSLGETVRSVKRKIGKKLSGSLGKERESHAHVLAKHFITHDCMLCQSIVSELLSDEEEEWLRYQEFPIVKGVLMEKFKSV